MTSADAMVIVGASLGGANAAETLRSEGYSGPIVLVGDEEHVPYERPPLSKEYLQGKAERDSVDVHPRSWYDEHDIDLRLGTTVSAIDPQAHTVTLSGGETVGYSKLLLATGSRPRSLDIPGAQHALMLRRIEDSDRLKAAINDEGGGPVVIIGGGWIGLETAAAARLAGRDVTVLEAGELPLGGVLGPELAQRFVQLHQDQGVQVRTKVSVQEIVSDGDTVTGVRLADGATVPAGTVVVGVGIQPNVEIAEAAGLTVDNGIRVSAALQTSDADIYAAGDVANADHPLIGSPVRVEHWDNAIKQAQAAARSMLGQDVSYDKVPYFFTDQYDLGMEYTGYVPRDATPEVVYRGDPGSGEYIAFWLDGSRVLAGMNVNVWDVADQIEALVRSGKPVGRARLTDPDVPLDQVDPLA